MMSNYANGRAIEYKVRDDLEPYGIVCIRAAGSKGCADLVGLHRDHVLLIQVKNSNPQLLPMERAELIELARICNGKPIVAYKPTRKPLQYRLLTGPGPKDWVPWSPKPQG